MILFTVKVTKCKLGPFKHAQSIFKWSIGSVYIGNIINYLKYLPITFPRGLEMEPEESRTFPKIMLLMHINRLGLVSHLY